jgi:hypothetical protein
MLTAQNAGVILKILFTKPPVWNKILSSYLWLKYQWLFNGTFRPFDRVVPYMRET